MVHNADARMYILLYYPPKGYVSLINSYMMSFYIDSPIKATEDVLGSLQTGSCKVRRGKWW